MSDKRSDALTCRVECRQILQRRRKAALKQLHEIVEFIASLDEGDIESIKAISDALAAKCRVENTTPKLPTLIDRVNHLHQVAREQVNRDDLLRSIAACSGTDEAQLKVLLAFQRWIVLTPVDELLWR